MSNTHSRSRSARRGGLSDTDPDRRVKYVLRRVLRDGALEVETRIVRRRRRAEERATASGQVSLLRRLERRRDRHRAAADLSAAVKDPELRDTIG